LDSYKASDSHIRDKYKFDFFCVFARSFCTKSVQLGFKIAMQVWVDLWFIRITSWISSSHRKTYWWRNQNNFTKVAN